MKDLSTWRIRRPVDHNNIEPEFTTISDNDSVHLRDYLKVISKRRWLAIGVFVVLLLVGAYFNFTATTVYTATATLKIEPQNPAITNIAEIFPAVTGAVMEYYQTQFVLLRSRTLAATVIRDLDLESNAAFRESRIVTPNALERIRSWFLGYLGFVSYRIAALLISAPQTTGDHEHKPLDAGIDDTTRAAPRFQVSSSLINRYLSFLEVTPVRGTRLVQVRFTTPDQSLSQALANHHAIAFLRMNLESRFELTNEAREYLEKKNAELRAKLEQSEAALHQFRQKHGVISLEKGENIIVDRLFDLNRQLTAVRAQRIEAESLYQTVQNKNNRDLAELMKQGLVPQLRSNVATLEAERARLSVIFKSDHPRIQELNQQITEARKALELEISNALRTIEANYTAARARESALQAETAKQQQLAMNLKEVGVQFAVLQEEVKSNRALYENVLRRLNETDIATDLPLSNMQITERAGRPQGASAPNIPLNLIFYSVFGVFLGVGLAFAVEYFDSTVGTPDAVWRSVGLNTLGVVPDLKFLKKANQHWGQIEARRLLPYSSKHAQTSRELITGHSPISILSEAYRSIRTSLLLSQAEKPPQVVLLTSPSPGEGKTVTTLNLSIALAQDGYSVLIIDGDMRKGSCHARLGLRNNRGLSNVLTGGLPLKQGIQSTYVNGLSLMSRGTIPPNPAELLGSMKMKEVLHELRQNFRFILIDSPPIVAVSDAAIMSVMSDGVLLVLNGQKTSTASAQKAVERLDLVRANFLGVVLNEVDLNDPDYSYYKSYSSYYAYEPNSEDDANGTNSDESPSAHHLSDTPNDASWSWDQEEDTKNVGTSGAANAQGNGGHGKITLNLTAADEVGSTREISSSADGSPPPATVSQTSLEKLIAALSVAIGPVAPLVVHEQITALSELALSFPQRRVPELLKLIEHQITRDELMRFQAAIPEEFRQPNLSIENT